MAVVKSSEFQKNVGFYLDALANGPVQITRYERPIGILISPSQYEELLSNYRKAIRVEDLSEDELLMIKNAKRKSTGFTMDDLPELEGRQRERA